MRSKSGSRLAVEGCTCTVDESIREQVMEGFEARGFALVGAAGLPARRDAKVPFSAVRVAVRRRVAAPIHAPPRRFARPSGSIVEIVAHWSQHLARVDQAMWLPVLDLATLQRTGVELWVVDDDDASHQWRPR